jgi:lipoprotein-releasing system ATP-binding protein
VIFSGHPGAAWPIRRRRLRRRGQCTSGGRLLDSVGLSKWRDILATNLSGGQQQRVAVARSLAMDPQLLPADEPTGNLDSRSADAVFTLLRQANRERGMAVLFVTHNAQLAGRCDRIIQVVDGVLAGTGLRP